MSAELERDLMRIRCVAVEVLVLVSRDIKHLCGPKVEILE